jgi:hypothetical protein
MRCLSVLAAMFCLAGCAQSAGEDAPTCEGAACDQGLASDRPQPLPARAGITRSGDGVRIREGQRFGAQFRPTGAVEPVTIYVLEAGEQPREVAESRPGEQPILYFRPERVAEYFVGVDTKSMGPLAGRLEVDVPESLWCKAESTRCDGDTLHICGHNLEDGRMRFHAVDCAPYGGCDAAVGNCRAAPRSITSCEGNTWFEWATELRQLWVIDCGERNQTCAAPEGICR